MSLESKETVMGNIIRRFTKNENKGDKNRCKLISSLKISSPDGGVGDVEKTSQNSTLEIYTRTAR